MTSPTKYYRPEIDGLRAVAVLLVILYHAHISIAGVRLFPAGYIGVDVFFVISGYLITTIIHRELTQGTFSILAFYERRARRILPALFSVLALTTLATWFILLPGEMKDYADSLLSTNLFGANIYFWLFSGQYAAESSAYLPLLHMWSLAVEEQFYLFYPPALLLAVRFFRNNILHAVAFSFIASLVLAEATSHIAPSANFYLMPTRAWELFAGTLVALYEPHRKASRLEDLLGTWGMPLGAMAILLFAIFCSDSTRHPSLLTLAPVLGSAGIIMFPRHTNPVIRFLSARPVVFVGLLSYSLYLWHQPVLAFARHCLSRNPEGLETLQILLLTLLLSIGSYFLVERPTRNRRKTSKRIIWTISAVGTAIFLTFAILAASNKGFRGRFPFFETMYNRMTAGQSPSEWDFHGGENLHRFQGNPSGKYTLFTLGDSHIRTLNRPIADRAAQFRSIAEFIPLTTSGNMFILGVDLIDLASSAPESTIQGNITINEQRLKTILQSKNPIAIWGGRMPLFLSGNYFDNLEGGREEGKEKFRFIRPTGQGYETMGVEAMKQALNKTIHTLLDKGVKVVLVYPIPEAGWNVPRKIASTQRFNWSADKMAANLKHSPLTTSYSVFRQRTADAYAVYDSIPEDPNLIRIFPEHLFCSDGRCRTHDTDALYYYDDDHLSYTGASMLFADILDAIETHWGVKSQDGGDGMKRVLSESPAPGQAASKK